MPAYEIDAKITGHDSEASSFYIQPQYQMAGVGSAIPADTPDGSGDYPFTVTTPDVFPSEMVWLIISTIGAQGLIAVGVIGPYTLSDVGVEVV